jgi:hypothetical protein
MSMSTATSRSHRVVFNLLIHHVIALLYRYELAVVVVAIVGEMTTWRQDDGDHGFKPVTMEIMSEPQDGDQRRKVMMAISCHILIACDVYPFMHLILLRTVVALYDDPFT